MLDRNVLLLEVKVKLLEDKVRTLELAISNLEPIIRAVTPKKDELLVELMEGFATAAKRAGEDIVDNG